MRIALPIFETRVSPRFDCAPTLLVVDTENGVVTGRQEIDMRAVPSYARVSFIRTQRVGAVLCGGLRRRDYFELEDCEIEVIAGLTGDAEEALESYLQGNLQTIKPFGAPFAGPFGRGHGRQRPHGPRGFRHGRRRW